MDWLRDCIPPIVANAARTVVGFAPSTADLTALIPNFRDTNGEPRYGLIAVTAGLATGATYFVLRSSFSNREMKLIEYKIVFVEIAGESKLKKRKEFPTEIKKIRKDHKRAHEGPKAC